jgi:hypothetical protein
MLYTVSQIESRPYAGLSQNGSAFVNRISCTKLNVCPLLVMWSR